MNPTLSRRALLAGLGLSFPAQRFAAAQGREPIVDTHCHLIRGLRRRDRIEDAVSGALGVMDRFGVERAIFLPPPFPTDHPGAYGLAQLAPLARRQPRFAFMAGGESLNGMIQDAPADRVPDGVARRFAEAAEQIAAAGAAGYGELTAEHFSSGRGGHPYESAPPDHPLLLALADIAARHGMPIELHMEAVPQDMEFPARRAQGANPPRLRANISRLERLLAHNRRTRIVWAHAGWDLTGERSVPLMRGLLGRHANLHMNIKQDRAGMPVSAPSGRGVGAIRPGWIELLRAFPDRFMIGSDQFMDGDTERIEEARGLVDALPPDLRRRIASENAKRVYRLPG